MPTPIESLPEDPGLLSSFLNELSLPGYFVKNLGKSLFRGDIEGVKSAGRNAADFGLNIVDAAIPFSDLFPEQSSRKDKPEFTDIVGRPDGFAGDALNFAGNILTDPVSLIPGAAFVKAGATARKAVKAVTPQVVQKGVGSAYKAVEPTLQKAGKTVRKTFGAQKIGAGVKDILTQAEGARNTAAGASQAALGEAVKGVTSAELDAIMPALHKMTKDKVTGELIDPSGVMSIEDHITRTIADYPELDPEKMLRVGASLKGIGEAQFASGAADDIGGNIFYNVAGDPNVDIVMGAVPGTTGATGIKDYIPHVFKKEDPNAIVDELLASPYALKKRKITTPRELDEHLNANPGTTLESLPKAYQSRGFQQGEMAARAATGKGLIDLAKSGQANFSDEFLRTVLPKAQGEASNVSSMLSGTARPTNPIGKEAIGSTPDVVMGGKQAAPETIPPLTDEQRKLAREHLFSKKYAHADPLMRQAAEDIAKALPGDEAEVALYALRGMNKRGGAAKVLNDLNKRFKPYAVYGALAVKLGSITRNMTGGIWNTLSNAEARGELVPALARAIPNWLKTIDDGIEHLFGVRFSKNEFKQIDEAYRLSGGDPRKAMELIKDPAMRSAVEHGVFGNNFIDMETLINSAAKGGWRAFGKKLMDYPAVMFKASEQRMRYGLWKDLTAKGKSPKDAARIIRDTFFDYRISSEENRLARDIIPFFQFPAKAIPQQAKFLYENPAIPGTPLRPLVSGLSQLYGSGNGDPVSPEMEGNVNIPIGRDEQGNRQYLTSLGLPFEALGMIPNFSANPLQAGRQFEKNVIGSLHPLLKTAYSYSAGHDPYFQTAPGSYTKVGGQDLGQAGSIINQVLGTGAPFASAAQGVFGTIGNAVDEKKSAGERLFNYVSGAKIKSVDPDRAAQSRIRSYLERDPSVGKYNVLYNKNQDEDVQSLLSNLKDAKKAIKEKQKALMPVN